ncbi:fluoride efflux transporter FluC [Liquorilactobacillus capillatus]|uniref:Fluoride-specific ion channel FluC n=1 Tax=Liquorilactobacillus capillatus DSM 19910 TaxID=1423731 RepID=A0A0R1MAW5_9LACO|nr:CrcB family protein [Liquorilactobacillus capillatus]KRL01139.1 hypothetical protein FC81_GL001278 [Liquorilactobacillus capillatus DSM 19910]
MIWLIGVGAALGSLLRFEITIKTKVYFKKNWPLATFLINLSGAFFLGYLFGLQPEKNYFLFWGTGIVGGLTTFSTLNTELLGLFNTHHPRTGLSYMALSYLGGILFFSCGYYVSLWN